MVIIETLQEENLFEFNLISENKKYCIDIFNKRGKWDWEYSIFFNQWFFFNLKNKKFIPMENGYSTKIIEKATSEFYEVLRHLKNNQSYRLKLIHLLDEKTREVWKEV